MLTFLNKFIYDIGSSSNGNYVFK